MNKDKFYRDFGRKLHDCRLQRNISYDEIPDKTPLATLTVMRMEEGKALKNFRLINLKAYCDSLNFDMEINLIPKEQPL